MDTEIVVSQATSFLSPAASIAQLRERYNVFNQFVKDILHENVDFQIIPGTDKPSLAKPGAEKLAAMFGLSARFTAVEKAEDWTGTEHGNEPFFYYVYRCELYRGDLFVASCDGSCNSREKKYRYRQQERVCPTCHKPFIFKSKQKPEWYCWSKKGGCGAIFRIDDTRITEQEVGLIPNPDIADTVNTIQKMAQKRAFVGAVLIATNASQYFTQDVEDMAVFVDANYEEVQQPKVTHYSPVEPIPPLAVETPAPVPTNGNGHKAAERPMNAIALRKAISIKSAKYAKTQKVCTQGARGLLVGQLEGLFDDKEQADKQSKRYRLTKYLVGSTSTKDITDADANALLDWVQSDAAAAKAEAANVLTADAVDAGQQTILTDLGYETK